MEVEGSGLMHKSTLFMSPSIIAVVAAAVWSVSVGEPTPKTRVAATVPVTRDPMTEASDDHGPRLRTEPSAFETIKDAQADIEALARMDPTAETASLRASVDALLDHEWIAVAVLGGPKRHADRCGSQCEEFGRVLRPFVRGQLLGPLRAHPDGRMQLVREHVRTRRSKVDTRLTYTEHGEQVEISVDYVLHRVDGRWRVRNIFTEGASLLKTVRYELRELHRRGGMDQVIAHMRDRLEQLEIAG